MQERILFIDFDGVLHPFGSKTETLFRQRHLLHRVLEQNSALRVVVHSSWRCAGRSDSGPAPEKHVYSDDDFRDMLFHDRPELSSRFFGTTDRNILSRWESIEAWVEKNQPEQSVCILDDEPRMFPSHIVAGQDPRYRFVECPSNQGLREYTPAWDKLRGWIYSRLERSAS